MVYAPWLDGSEKRERYDTRHDNAAGATGRDNWATTQGDQLRPKGGRKQSARIRVDASAEEVEGIDDDANSFTRSS